MQRVGLFVERFFFRSISIHIYRNIERPAPAAAAIRDFNAALDRRIWLHLALSDTLCILYSVKNSTHDLACSLCWILFDSATNSIEVSRPCPDNNTLYDSFS